VWLGNTFGALDHCDAAAVDRRGVDQLGRMSYDYLRSPVESCVDSFLLSEYQAMGTGTGTDVDNKQTQEYSR
jgi:hypothetical protein